MFININGLGLSPGIDCGQLTTTVLILIVAVDSGKGNFEGVSNMEIETGELQLIHIKENGGMDAGFIKKL